MTKSTFIQNLPRRQYPLICIKLVLPTVFHLPKLNHLASSLVLALASALTNVLTLAFVLVSSIN